MKFPQFVPLLQLFLLLSCTKSEVGTVPKEEESIQVRPDFAKGADVGWITEMEVQGIKFYNNTGTATEGMALLKSLGMNTIRLRVWVNPSPRYNDANDVLAKAQRAKTLGMRIMIDFHYSDSWADPGQQTKPAAWANLDVEGLKKAVTVHTKEVLTLLKTNDITPEWVQVGNETNNGMLWPEGRASTNMANFAGMVNAGYDAVKAIFPTAKVIVHISNGWDNALFRWIFDGLIANSAKFDVIGLSLYPNATNWQTYNNQCLATMTDLINRYNKEVMVVEVGMPWDNAAECNLFLKDLITKTNAIPNQKGLGVLYWEPLAYNRWQGYTLGAFDNSGKPTEALKAFAN
jgi:arabinogalactan endo-1,4-beta-galactosidase